LKKTLALLLVAGIGFAIGHVTVARHLAAQFAEQLARQQADWEAERAALEGALAKAEARPQVVLKPAAPTPVDSPTTTNSPAEIVARLRALKTGAGPARSRAARQAIRGLEELIAAGPAALPAIREFLTRNEDVDFEFAPTQGKGARGVPNDFVLPPSLRFGLLDVAKQIGGADGEKLLAEVLASTGRAVEVAWLARVLQEMAPDKYRESALASARELLARPPTVDPASPLDRNERDNLFSVLAMYGDTSFVSTAQAQLVRDDGEVDPSALKYLQQSLGPQAVAIALQKYDDPRLVDPARKEPLVRLALNYVGADAQADDFYQKAINDLSLPKNDRKNLIEDLNQDGFLNRKNLSARDLPLIQNRLTLIEQLAPNATDPINVAAFKEAYKDLLKMRERILQPPAPDQ